MPLSRWLRPRRIWVQQEIERYSRAVKELEFTVLPTRAAQDVSFVECSRFVLVFEIHLHAPAFKSYKSSNWGAATTLSEMSVSDTVARNAFAVGYRHGGGAIGKQGNPPATSRPGASTGQVLIRL
jgi:hypothetical protein